MGLLGAQFVNAVSPSPVGVIEAFAGASAPSGWLLCDGGQALITAYPELYSVLGTTYGSLTNGSGGAGSTHFRVPDMRGRVPIGAGTGTQNGGSGSGVITGGTALTARTRGQFGGDERLATHNHSISDPGHTHQVPQNAGPDNLSGPHTGNYDVNTFGVGFYYTTTNSTTGISVQNNANGGSGGNMPPFVVINYIIKAVPDAPRSGLAYGSTPPIVTALPTNPQFGDVVTYIADATNGVAWNLQYDASGTYPWKFVGGSALWAENTSGTTTTSSSYVTTNMPSLTVPLSGDYMMDFGGFVQKTSSTAGVADMKFGLHVNGVEKANTGESNTTQNDGGGTRRNYRVTGVVAGQSADIRIKSSSGATAYTTERTLVVTPIRVAA